MNINELDNFRLADAVKFNNDLNPRLWQHEQLRPEAREKMLAIANDFREFLGISDLDVKDITISGSNAAYTYTDHSDIDLHLVVDLPQHAIDEVYRELFDAKKYQYNDEHDYRIGGADVELYVQLADQPHVSQGIYSIVDDTWIKVPSRRSHSIDDMSVRSKYEDLASRIDQAIESGDLSRLEQMSNKISTMRKSGLAATGEFGTENITFKLLRARGDLDRLRQARLAAKDQEFSLAEAERNKNKKPQRYGYQTYWFPGYDYYAQSADIDPGLIDAVGGESQTNESLDNNDTEPKDIKEILRPFIKSCIEHLGIKKTPKIILKRDTEWTRQNGTFGHYNPDAHSITLAVSGRHTLDILRTLAHELTHAHQNELATMPVDAGATGSPYEDDANAQAGRIMRHWADQHPEYFKDVQLEDHDPTYNVNEALDQPYKILRWEKGDYGDVDAIARLDDNTFLSIMFNKGFSQETKEEAWSVEFYRDNSQEITGKGDEFRVFATVLSAIQTFVSDRVPGAKGKYKPNKVYFSASKQVEPGQKEQSRAGLYDSLVQRYARALGFTSSRSDTGNKVMYELNRIKPAVAESTGYIPVNDKEARDPRYSMAITQDIRPGEVQRQAAKMGFKTDAAGVPPLLMAKLQNQLREIKIK